MPRLSVHHSSRDGGWNEHMDYCRRCYPSHRAAVVTHGPDVDMDNEHPPYQSDEYFCEACLEPLTERDN